MSTHSPATNSEPKSLGLGFAKTRYSGRSSNGGGAPNCLAGPRKKIWIDLDNTPHVPFFLPIIDELKKNGCEVVITARDAYQVCELLKLHGISCRIVGKHWGKNRALKIIGTLVRCLRLIPVIRRQKPVLAVSHGSRALFLCSALLRIPHLLIYDYEYTANTGFLHPQWALSPEYICNNSHGKIKARFDLHYPGLKEDVYVSRFKLDSSIRCHLGLRDTDLVVTVRPPATEAHYHNPDSEILLDAAVELVIRHPNAKIILLPRNGRQRDLLMAKWKAHIDSRKIVVPECALEGLNLIWSSDLVISGGGTMNREAAAMGVPVYSIFRGRIGAVDHCLASAGRLVLLRDIEDVRTKILLRRRQQISVDQARSRLALSRIVQIILSIAEGKNPDQMYA